MRADACVPTPDNDAWPVAHAIRSAELDSGHVRVTWDDGHANRFHAMWLRDNCACAQCTHPVTREQRIDLLDIPDDIQALEAGVDGDGALRVVWRHDTHVSRFNPGWLRAHDPGSDPERPRSPRVLWRAAELSEPPSFDGRAAMADDDVLFEALEAVLRLGLARLRSLPAEPGTVERVALRLGPIRGSHFERVFNVLSRDDADSNAYTSAALPAHADMPTREVPHGVQLLHCLVNSVEGGESVMVDGFRIAEDMRQRFPGDFENLASVQWTYANRAGNTDYRWRTPHFVLDGHGRIEEVRLAAFSRAPLVARFEEVGPSYSALRRYLAMTYADEYRLVFRLAPGDLVLFDNRRILHARNAFDAATGERHLQGTYVDRDDLLSTVRMIERRRRARALVPGPALPAAPSSR